MTNLTTIVFTSSFYIFNMSTTIFYTTYIFLYLDIYQLSIFYWVKLKTYIYIAYLITKVKIANYEYRNTRKFLN